MAAGYKDGDGHGKPNNTQAATGGSNGTRPTNGQQYDDQAKKTGEANGIHVGRIPGQTKIAGKLKTKCSDQNNNIQLGSQSGTVGRKNGGKNKKLYGEIEVRCQNKTHTLYLKGDDETQSKKGGYGRIK